MKKVLSLIFTLFSFTFYAQDSFNLGVHGGFTVDKSKEFSSLGVSLDVNYLLDLSEDFNAGGFIGYVHFLPKDDLEARAYIPVGGAIRFNSIDEYFYVGGDLGFAIGISPDGDNGGVYFRPLLGYKITDSFKVDLSYTVIKKRVPTYSFIGLGLVFDFNGSSNYYAY